MNHTSATKGRIMSESLCVYSKIPHFFLISESVRLQCSEMVFLDFQEGTWGKNS